MNPNEIPPQTQKNDTEIVELKKEIVALKGKREKTNKDKSDLIALRRDLEDAKKEARPKTKLSSSQKEELRNTISRAKTEDKTVSTSQPDVVVPGVFVLTDENKKMQEEMDALATKKSHRDVQAEIETAILIETKLDQKIMEPKFDMNTNPVEKDKTQTQKYNEGYERIWGKDKDKTPENSKEQPTIKNWQDEAIENFEKGGGKVLDPELVSKSVDTVVTPSTSPETKGFHALDIEQAAIMIKAQEGLKAAEGAVEARTEKAKVPFGIIGKVAEAYKNYPLSLKLTIAAALAVSGIGAGIMGAAALAGTAGAIGIGMRVGAGALTFIGVEKWLKASHEKNTGKEREVGVGVRHTAEAAALAIVIGAFVPTIVRHGLEATGVSDAILDKIIKYGPGVAPVEAAAINTPVEYIKEIRAGDSVWKIAAGVVAEKFPNLSAEQQTYFTDAIKDRVVAYPESFGIEGSDASNLAIGERIDFGGILNDEEFMNKTLSSAQNLSTEEIANIQNPEPEGVTEPETPPTQTTDFTKEELKTWEPVIPVDGSPSTNLAAEELPVGQEAGNSNALVEAGTLKGAFQYGPKGEVTGFSVKGALEYPQTLETQKLLNPNWRAGLSSLDSSAVQMNANTVYSYEQLLHSLEQKGAGSSPEATFLRDGMDRLITDTEKMSGTDVFKDNIVYPPESSSHINLPTNPEVMAQINAQAIEVTDRGIKSALGKTGWLLGIGSSDGQEIFKNFADLPAEQLVGQKDLIISPEKEAVIKMIEDAMKETGLPLKANQTVEDYLHDAAVVGIQNYNKTK